MRSVCCLNTCLNSPPFSKVFRTTSLIEFNKSPGLLCLPSLDVQVTRHKENLGWKVVMTKCHTSPTWMSSRTHRTLRRNTKVAVAVAIFKAIESNQCLHTVFMCLPAAVWRKCNSISRPGPRHHGSQDCNLLQFREVEHCERVSLNPNLDLLNILVVADLALYLLLVVTANVIWQCRFVGEQKKLLPFAVVLWETVTPLYAGHSTRLQTIRWKESWPEVRCLLPAALHPIAHCGCSFIIYQTRPLLCFVDDLGWFHISLLYPYYISCNSRGIYFVLCPGWATQCTEKLFVNSKSMAMH